MKKKKLRRVMISTTTIDGKLDVHYVQSLIGTILQGYLRGIEIIPFQIAYDSLLQRARNDIFYNAYKSEIDDLIMIDSDQSWNPEDIFKLLNYELDFIGVAIQKKSDTQIDYNIKTKKGNLEIRKDNLSEVEGVGLGCLRITKDVIKKIFESSEKYNDQGIEKGMIFNVIIKDNELIGEDIYFCHTCKDLGFKILIDPYIKVDHWAGNKNYNFPLIEFCRLNKKVEFLDT